MDNIRDRGNIKWTSMMLVEHKNMLQELGNQQRDVDPPNLEEDQWEMIQHCVALSLQQKKEIHLTYWKDKRFCVIKGIVTDFDGLTGMISIEKQDKKETIRCTRILDADIHEEF